MPMCEVHELRCVLVHSRNFDCIGRRSFAGSGDCSFYVLVYQHATATDKQLPNHRAQGLGLGFSLGGSG